MDGGGMTVPWPSGLHPNTIPLQSLQFEQGAAGGAVGLLQDPGVLSCSVPPTPQGWALVRCLLMGAQGLCPLGWAESAAHRSREGPSSCLLPRVSQGDTLRLTLEL